MEKNEKMRKIVFMLLTALAPCLTTAQNNQLEVDIQADIVSKSLWRGQDLGGVSLQPKADISWNGIYLNATGSTGFVWRECQRWIALDERHGPTGPLFLLQINRNGTSF